MVGELKFVAVRCRRALALVLAVMLAAWALPAIAQTTPGRVEQDPVERLLKEQREREREQRLNQAPPQIAVPAPQSAAGVPLDADPTALADAEPTFRIDHIELLGNTLLGKAETKRIVAPFRGKKLGANRINLLLRRLTEAFIAKGYITTRVYLGEQNLASGTLRLTIVPGKIEGFQINGQTIRSLAPTKAADHGVLNGGWFTDLGTLAAFPASVGETLNLRDLEQGVDQVNRLRRNQAELQILPGQTPGGSLVALNNQPGDRYRVNIGVDNYGSRATGSTRTRLGVDFDNPLGFQEAFALAYVGSLDTNALLATAAVPMGYSIFSYTASYSEYQNLIGDTAILFGRTLGHTLGWNYVLTRSRSEKSGLDITLSTRRAEREINNILLTPQRLSVARIGWNHLARFGSAEQPGNWTIDAGVARGLKAFEASNDASDLAQADAHSQFTKLDVTATIGLPVSQSWGYRGIVTGQWSRVGLFASEHIYAGGAGSVRGFSEGGISGERGFYFRNELTWMKAPQPTFLDRPIFLQPYVFVDAGRTELIAQKQWKQLAGAGFGVRAQWQTGKQQVFLDALVGAPLTQPAELGGKKAVAQAILNWTF